MELQMLYTGILLLILPLLYHAIYILYLHPLSRIPGPKTWILSRIPYALALRSGYFAIRIRELHRIYGPIVRIAQDEVSFTNKEAWYTIYSPQKGHAFPKSPVWYRQRPNGAYGIMGAPNSEHSRFRRAFAPAFTERVVKEQEPLICRHVDILMRQLRKETSEGGLINILKWFEYSTFDIIGDLCFGDSFRCLESDENRIQISILQSAMKAFAQAVVPRVLGLESLWNFITPLTNNRKRTTYHKSLNDWTRRRFNEGGSMAKDDLLTYVHRRTENKGLSICGHFLPPGTHVSFSQLAAYTSADNFSSPEQFIPSRWLVNSKMDIHNSDAFHPFSIGPRNCIGKSFGLLEVKLIIARLLWEFKIEKEPQEWEWDEQRAYLLWEKRPLFVKMVPKTLSES
ncbi:hypothetical protein BOTCAL_0570g00020 [Botryotinia calthae]|uniref:Cytochrome P450 n=1 Tax=Botryotinia calthae TaxID=38488 RepID=A0A4Y8CJK3_9HELO|nr:hypothetical protein BOTCAL_0570g00020 [Botryotinia calthae]